MEPKSALGLICQASSFACSYWAVKPGKVRAVSYQTMYRELQGLIPKLPRDYCKTLINRSRADVYRKNLWSFLLFDANWFSPAVLNAGTVSATQGTSTVTFNATALAAINAVGVVPSPVTARQFRVGVNPIYNIWGWDQATGIATLDRIYSEASVAASPYTIFQCYYPAPMKDFKMWLSVRDTVNARSLCTTKEKSWLDNRDPQRQNYLQPTHVVLYGSDKNPASSTYGYPLFELWGQPQYELPYALFGIRHGQDLVNDGDELPAVIGEDVVIELAKVRAYEWAEANKGDHPRMMGPNYTGLIQLAAAEFKRLWHEYRRADMELVDNWIAGHRYEPSLAGYYNAIAGVASPGFD